MRLSGPSGFLSVALLWSTLALPCAAAPGDTADAAVVRRPVPAPEPAPPPVKSNPPAGSASSRHAPTGVVPPGSIYVCVYESGGVRWEMAIAFSPEVGVLCAKHPEMGPCQYERNACRRGGGRVYAGGGVEITPQMEAEYDRRVTRVLIK
jgi:hypothetical protein